MVWGILIILIYILLSIAVGFYAKGRKLGFDLGFLISLFVSPLTGFIIALINTDNKHVASFGKIISASLIFYTIAAGLLLSVPALPILHESIRNLYFHVTQWFGMMIILFISLWYSIRYLTSYKMQDDFVAAEAANVGIYMGILGIVTGSIWAKFTWGAWWVSDAKLNGAAITLLIYFAYLILRNSIDEEQKRARVAAVYNIFAFVMLIIFLMVLPRLTDSLHPGNGGNPGFGGYDLNSNMKLVFYPAIYGWTLLGIWLLQVCIRIRVLKHKLLIKQFK